MTQPGKVAVFQLPGEGEALTTPAGTVVVKVDSDQTAGTMALLEYAIAAGAGGPPVHVHPSFDELFFVLQGEIEFRAGEESVRAPAGTTFYTPGTEPHTFSNLDGPP